MANLSPAPKLQFFDANGDLLVGGKLYSYAAGTTTPLATFTDSTESSTNPNPTILDSRGEANVWLGSSQYKLKLTTSTDVEIWTVDNIGGGVTLNQLAAPSGAALIGNTPAGTIAATTVQAAINELDSEKASSAALAASSGSSLVGFLQSGTGAVTRTAQAKMRESVSVKDFGAVGDNVTDDTAAIEAASLAVATGGGGTLYFPEGSYKYTRLTIRSAVMFQGDGHGSTFLICTDFTTLDSGVSLGSSMRALDNNVRVVYAGFRDISIYAGATSGVSAQQDIFQNIIGLNLCMCERTVIENVSFGGWGQGAMVFARAENGVEGLGFINSAQDGNYNQVTNVNMGSCGKYNTDAAAVWLKYKANSNKFYGTYAKGMTGSGVIAIPNGNDNLFAGGTAESCAYIVKMGGGTGASGNTVLQFRAEGLTGNGYEFLASADNNYVFGGYHTGVSGTLYVDANGSNRIISDRYNKLKTVDFPPVSNYSTLHNIGALQVTSVNGDTDYPLYIKSETTNDPTKYPYQLFWNDVSGGVSGSVLGRIGWRNSDTSGGAAGVSGVIEAQLQDSAGSTSLVFQTGTGTTLSEKFRIRANGAVVQTLPTTAVALTDNSTMTMTLTADTNLRISVRGSDGVTRTTNLTLA